MVEAGTGVGKSFAYLVPAILAAAERARRSSSRPTRSASRSNCSQKDIPFLRAVMPQEFTATLVKGRSNYVSLRRLEAAQARATRSSAPGRLRPARPHCASGRRQTEDGSRSDLDFQPEPAGLGCRRQRQRQLPGQEVPPVQRLLLLQGPPADVDGQHPGRQPRPVLQRPGTRRRGFGLLPEYDVAIFDEAHTLEAVAGDHLGLRVTERRGRLPPDPPLQRARPARAAGLSRDGRGRRQARRTAHGRRHSSPSSPTGNAGTARPTAGSAVPCPSPTPSATPLRRLAAAIGQGAEEVEEEEQRVELTAARTAARPWPPRSAAGSTRATPSRSTGSTWITGPRERVTLAAAPLEVGPTLRRDLFDEVPTCMLTSATLAVGTPPGFQFAKSRLGLTARVAPARQPVRLRRSRSRSTSRANLPDPSAENTGVRAGLGRGDPALPGEDPRQGLRAVHLAPDALGAARELAPWLCRAEHRPVRPVRRHAAVEDGRGVQADVRQRPLRHRRASGRGWTCRARPSRTSSSPGCRSACPTTPCWRPGWRPSGDGAETRSSSTRSPRRSSS